MSTWWRRNRWALLVLPLALVLAAASTSYRVVTLWNPWQLTDEVSGTPGSPVRLVDELEDVDGTYVVDLTVSAGSARTVTSLTDEELDTVFFPARTGTVVWQIDLTVTADPASVVSGCQLRLVDREGRETAYSTVAPGAEVPFDPCVPATTPGPRPDVGLGPTVEEGPARPETYTVPVVFRTAEDFVPARLDLWYATPRFASLDLTVEED